MAKGPCQPELACRLAPCPDRCAEQKLAQVYRRLVPESDRVVPPELKGEEHETTDRHLR